MAQIKWTEKAVIHLEGIYNYIANDSPVYAKRFIDSLISATDKLCDFPQSGRVVPEISRYNLREILYRNYRIIYRISHKNDIVEILSIIHSARNADQQELTGES